MTRPDHQGRRTAREELGLRTRYLPQTALDAVRERTVGDFLKAVTRNSATVPAGIDATNPQQEPINNQEVLLPPSAVTLGMFTTEDSSTLAPLVRYYSGHDIDIIAAHADTEVHEKYEQRRWERYHKYHSDITREQYNDIRDEQLRQQREKRNIRLNRHVFARVQEELERGTLESAAIVFEAQRQHANDTVRNIAKQVFPDDDQAKQRNEVDLPQRPADLVNMYFSVDGPTDELLIKEIKRQALLTTISLQIEKGKKGGAEYKLTQIQNLLDNKLYAGPKGATTHKEFFGVFQNDTNAIIMAEGKPQISYLPPTEEAPQGYHYKHFVIPMREIQETGEFALTEIGEKERPSSVIKALNNAHKEANKGRTDDIRAHEIEDTHRMMIVIDGNESTADKILERVFDILTDDKNSLSLCNRDFMGNPIMVDGELTGLPIDFKIKHGTKDGNGSADKVGNHRILINFDGLATPIEIIVKPLYNYFYSMLEVGTYDPSTNTYSGVSHDIYKNARATIISDITHPESEYPKLVRPNVSDEKGNYPSHIGLENTVDALRKKAVWQLTM